MDWLTIGAIIAYVIAMVTAIILFIFFRSSQNQESNTRKRLNAALDEAEKHRLKTVQQEDEISSLRNANAVLSERNQQLQRLEQYAIHLNESEAIDKVTRCFLPLVKSIKHIHYSEQFERLSLDVVVENMGLLDTTISKALIPLIKGLSIIQRYEFSFVGIGVYTIIRDRYGKPWHRHIMQMHFDRSTIRKIHWGFIEPEGLCNAADMLWRCDQKKNTPETPSIDVEVDTD